MVLVMSQYMLLQRASAIKVQCARKLSPGTSHFVDVLFESV